MPFVAKIRASCNIRANSVVLRVLNLYLLRSRRNEKDNQSEQHPGTKWAALLSPANIANVSILFADELTGNLDRDNAATLLNYMKELSEAGGVVVMVTHDDCALGYATRKIALCEGMIRE